MQEPRRLAYLDAMGVDALISRRQLPGAAPTRRLALDIEVADSRPAPASPVERVELPDLDTPPTRRKTQSAAVTAPRQSSGTAASPEHFTLATVLAGQWLWLEDIGGNPLGREQVRLIHCMARALTVAGAPPVPGEGLPESAAPDVALFQWPIHTNDQFDLGPESARVSASCFVARRLQQSGCVGLVCLGASSASRLDQGQFGMPLIATHSTVDMLAEPALKQVVWQQLAPLVAPR